MQDRSELGISDFSTSIEDSEAALGGKKDKDKAAKKGKQGKAKKEPKGEEDEGGDEDESKDKSGSELVASRPGNVRYVCMLVRPIIVDGSLGSKM